MFYGFPKANTLTSEHLREIFLFDSITGIFLRKKTSGGRKAGSVVGHIKEKGYRVIWVKDRVYTAHRLAWLYMYGSWPSDQIDHIDGNPDNNAISNLREASNKQNSCNVRISKRNTSGIKGVSWHKGKKSWTGSIRVDRRLIYLGQFSSIHDAEAAVRIAREKLHGKFCRHQ